MKTDTAMRGSTSSNAPLGSRSSVLALVPHFRCEQWLGDCLESLMAQTRPLQGIAVIDDHSETPPLAIVRQFPAVTLFTAEENVGPYRLIQEVINRTGYDAYLFNDADDWSAPDRLETLLVEADRTGAALIGSHEVRILCDGAAAQPVRYPLDVNAALHEQPCAFPLLHPTSLVARSLVMGVGGFATGMRFSGDAEFLRRAAHAGRVVNVPRFLYFRRKRAGALTTSPETGLRSPARLEVQQVLWDRARRNADRVAAGEPPELAPLSTAGPVHLEHLLGPTLAPPSRRSWAVGHGRAVGRAAPMLRPTPAPPASPSRRPPRPVFIIGGPGSGLSLLAWSLDQHPNLRTLPDASWVGRLAQDLQASLRHRGGESDGRPAPEETEAWIDFGHVVHRLAAPTTTTRWVDATPENVFHVYGLHRLFPEARFIHLVRDLSRGPSLQPSDGGAEDGYYTAAAAADRWTRAARAGLAAERALGSGLVVRVRYDDLVLAPADTLRRCLAHLGEPFSPECLRPLAGVSGSAVGPAAAGEAPPDAEEPAGVGEAADAEEPAGVGEAERLGRELTGATQAAVAGDPAALAELARGYVARSGHQVPELAEESPVRRLTAVIRAAVPPGAAVLVVSRGDDELLRLDGRQAGHFPQTERGAYAGYHPADSQAAIEHLERLRQEGAEYLVFPGTAFWWLDFYPGLREYLERHGRLAAYQEETCLIYALRPRVEPSVLTPTPTLLVEARTAPAPDTRMTV